MTRKTETPSPSEWADSIEEIERLKLIYAVCPTGAKYVLRTMTLDELAALEGLPDYLVRVALLEMTEGGIRKELARLLHTGEEDDLEASMKLSEANLQLTNRLVRASVVAPPLTAKQVEQLDGYDKAMIAGIASRQVQFDAAGRRVGVEPISTLATFLRLHGCPESCPACEATLVELSTVQPG